MTVAAVTATTGLAVLSGRGHHERSVWWTIAATLSAAIAGLLSPWTIAFAQVTRSDVGIDPYYAAERNSAPSPTSYGHIRCELPFSALPDGYLASGHLAKPINCNQFREVVLVTARSWTRPDESPGICSGTLIAERWVLTAAHCFLWEPSEGGGVTYLSTTEVARRSVQDAVHADLRRRSVPGNAVRVQFPRIGAGPTCSDTSGPEDAFPSRTLIVHRSFTGRSSDGPFRHDLALIELPEPVAGPLEIQPARLAAIPEDFDRRITIAGYGFTHENGGRRIGALNVGFPNEIDQEAPNETLSFSLKEDASVPRSTFCRGDSGGPAFFGRHRGCRSLADERRPRPLAGVISHLMVGPRQQADRLYGHECSVAPRHQLVSVATAEAQDWICRNTDHAVLGCPR